MEDGSNVFSQKTSAGLVLTASQQQPSWWWRRVCLKVEHAWHHLPRSDIFIKCKTDRRIMQILIKNIFMNEDFASSNCWFYSREDNTTSFMILHFLHS